LKGNDEKEYLFKLDIKEEVPVDKKGKPTISQQDITRKKGILYKVSVDSIENSGVSISTNCVSTNLTQIVSSLVVELSLDIESRYNPLEEKNSVSLFVDLARMRALEKLN